MLGVAAHKTHSQTSLIHPASVQRSIDTMAPSENARAVPPTNTGLTFKSHSQVDPKASRRGRQDVSIRIRKSKKGDRVKAHRVPAPPPVPTESDPDPFAPKIFMFAHFPQQSPAEICDELLQCVDRLVHDNGVPGKRLNDALKQVRRELQKSGPSNDAMMQQLFQRGVPHALVQIFLSDMGVSANDLCEAAWILINVTATGSDAHVTTIAQTPGLIDAMAPHIMHPTASTLCQQIIWCFANIAGTGGENRKLAFRNPVVVEGLMQNLSEPPNMETLSAAAWLLAGGLKGCLLPDEICLECAPLVVFQLQKAIQDKARHAVLRDVLDCTSGLVAMGGDILRSMVENYVLKAVIEFVPAFGEQYPDLLLDVNVILGNCASDPDDAMTQRVAQCGIFQHKVVQVMTNCRLMKVRRKYLWMLSNVVAVPECHKKFIKATHLWPKVIEMAGKDLNLTVRYEAMWVLTNLITKGSLGKTFKLCNGYGTIAILVQYLCSTTDHALTTNVLEALDKILTVSDMDPSHDFMKQKFLDSEGLEIVEQLQLAKNFQVYKAASYILETHFDYVESEAEDQNIAPALAPDGQTFVFSERTQLVDEEKPAAALATTTTITTPNTNNKNNNSNIARVELGDHSNMEF